MTTAPQHSPLVERVARAIFESRWPFSWEICSKRTAEENLGKEAEDCRREAQAAIAACHAEEMRESLKAVMAELWWCASQGGFDWKDAERRKVSSVGRAYDRSQALLAKLDGQP